MNKKPTILLVDDIPENIQLLGKTLGNKDYNIALALSGEQALELAHKISPDIILLDVNLPDIDGFSLCKQMKQSKFKSVPIIFLTSRTEKEDIIAGFEAGGIDYITKPFYANEVISRVNSHIKLKQNNEQLNQLVKDLQEEVDLRKETEEKLILLNNQLKTASTTDPLTGLFNRRELLDKLQYETTRFIRSKKVFSMILIDIDFFKRINDTYGHLAGDLILKNLSRIFLENLRKQDLACRWGGEEFLLLLPETENSGCMLLAKKLQEKIRQKESIFNGKSIKITVSMGIGTYDQEQKREDFIKIIDNRLYHAKESGRDQIVSF